MVLALAVLLAVPAIAWSVSKWSQASGDGDGPRLHIVTRGEFIHDVTERGNVESASNVDIVSKVKSASGGSYSGNTILEIVPEGTIIKPEDCLPEGTQVTYQDLQRLKEYEKKLNASQTTGSEPDEDADADTPEPTEEVSDDEEVSPAATDAAQTGQGQEAENMESPLDGDESEEAGIAPEVLRTKLMLVKLDSSSLENQLLQQQILCENSRATVIQAQNAVDVAEIARNEYLEGTHQEELLQMDIQIKEAEVELSQAQQYLAFSERLERKGYITKQQLQDDKTRVMKAQNALELARKQQEVLKEFNRDKMERQLTADIMTAKAKLKAEQASHQLDLEKLKLIEEQIAHCTIYATAPGQVVYANTEGHRGQGEIVIEPGTVIRENQVIIRLPDPTKMQVKAKINEARIALVKAGMEASIQLDAFPDVELEGVVEEVSDYAAPSSWFRSDIKEYETTIEIFDSQTNSAEGGRPGSGKAPEVKTGMTAQVRIRVEHLQDVVQVPVQTIIEHGDRHYCAFYDKNGFRAHEVTIGPTNDKFVVIEKGLEPGQKIVLNAAAYREKLGLPELPPNGRRRSDRPDGPPEVQPGSRPGPESEAGAEPGPGSGSGMPPSEGGPRPARPPSPAEAFKRMDKDGDGKLVSSELPPPFQSGMSDADTNGNGAIELGEFTAIISRLRSQNPGGGRPGAGQPGGGRPGGGLPGSGGPGGGRPGGGGQGGRP